MNQQEEEKEVHQNPVLQNQSQYQKNPVEEKKGRVKIDFYTDPLCCWSWAFENSWRSLLSKYGAMISYEYIMCGMIADWNSYHDDMNSVSKPLQMGPVWMHASQVTHVKMRYDIWHLDPPGSSYPACIAVKIAGLQSKAAEEKYLFEIRKGLMEEALNISRPDVLVSIAEKMDLPGFDPDKFKNDWQEGLGKKPFREDLQKAKFHDIGRFPSLTFINQAGDGIIITGYRPANELLDVFENFLGGSV
jgi:putative protein-disulfide isomerase